MKLTSFMPIPIEHPDHIFTSTGNTDMIAVGRIWRRFYGGLIWRLKPSSGFLADPYKRDWPLVIDMSSIVQLSRYIASLPRSALAPWADLPPWELTAESSVIVRSLLPLLARTDFAITGEIAVHCSAIVEAGSVLKGPLILNAGCFVAAGAYLRGGCWIDANCTFGPGAELKSSFVFFGTKLAHFNFVGDSVLGENVNLEAGSNICNYRNERAAKEVLVLLASGLHGTGREKFGALVGDGSRIGANAVVAPGALLPPGSVVRRTELCDQECVSEERRGCILGHQDHKDHKDHKSYKS